MNCDFTDKEETFRKEVRGWLEANLPDDLRGRAFAASRADPDEGRRGGAGGGRAGGGGGTWGSTGRSSAAPAARRSWRWSSSTRRWPAPSRCSSSTAAAC